MSRMEVYGVRKDGEVELFRELGNSWLGAIRVWNRVAEKYLGPTVAERFLFDPKMAQQVWNLEKDPRLDPVERLIFGLTLDRVIARDFEACAVACEAFNEGHYGPPLAGLLREMKTQDYQGVCFNQTSVSQSHWWIYSRDANDNDDGRPYNISTDTDHWWLEDELAQHAAPASPPP